MKGKAFLLDVKGERLFVKTGEELMAREVNFGKMLHGGDYNRNSGFTARRFWKKTSNILKKRKSMKYPWVYFPGQYSNR